MKYSFKNDYSKGCHPNILSALVETNMYSEEGYGDDQFSVKAKEMISELVGGNPEIYFVSGGTQANITIISSILKPYESIIASNSAHIQVHEAGAIEATGHRIQVIDSVDGKLTVENIKQQLMLFEEVHTTIPRLVYISNSTEVGTIYKKSELIALYNYCQSVGLLLFLDGARLSLALASKYNDLELSDLGKYTDVFYIGGTKAGALIGEAIVINNNSIKKNFIYNIKQKGALLAKGRLLGIQFLELFKDNLHLKLGAHANSMAYTLEKEITALGFDFLSQTAANQLFPILPDHLISELQKKYGFYVWKKLNDNQSAIRLVTCWATEPTAIEIFIHDLKHILNTK